MHSILHNYFWSCMWSVLFQVGVQTIIMLFIFAKRQVMRFALRSRRGPHVSVGQVKSFLLTLNDSFIHSCPLLFTPAHTNKPLPAFIQPCPVLFTPAILLFTPALFYSPLLSSKQSTFYHAHCCVCRAVWSSWGGRLIEGSTMSTMSLMSHRWNAAMVFHP